MHIFFDTTNGESTTPKSEFLAWNQKNLRFGIADELVM